MEDLISISTIGLIKAIESFSPNKGTKLATFAARCIENEIPMHLRRMQMSQFKAVLYTIVRILLVAHFFQSMGLPGALGYIVAICELIGGIALIIGIGTRYVSIIFNRVTSKLLKTFCISLTTF